VNSGAHPALSARQRVVDRDGVNVGVSRRIAMWLAPAILLVVAWNSHVTAHHPGGGSEPLVLIDSRRDGYRAVLEVYPPDPLAGRPTQFMLWVMPERWGTEFQGAARLWIQQQSSPAPPPMVIPMPEGGRRSGVYLMEHRFDRGGTYHVEVELAGLPTRWTGTLQVDPASGWIVTIVKAVVMGGLVAAFVLYLWRQEASRGRAL